MTMSVLTFLMMAGNLRFLLGFPLGFQQSSRMNAYATSPGSTHLNSEFFPVQQALCCFLMLGFQ